MKIIGVFLRTIFVFTAFLSLFACGGSNTGSEQKTALTVINTTPNDQESNVTRANVIDVEFSLDINSTTVTNNTFVVRDQFDNLIEFDRVNIINNIITFIPKAKFYPSRKYTVSISKEVMSLSGSVMNEDYTFSFTAQANSWSSSAIFKQSGGYSTTAMDDQGNAIIVTWAYNYSNSHYELTREEFRDSVWSGPVLISNIPGQSYNAAYLPVISMDNNGNAIIIWYQTGNAALIMTEYRNGAWSIPKILGELVNVSNGHSIAMNDLGNAIIVWGTNDKLYMSEFINKVWTPATLVLTAVPANGPKIAIDNNGNGVLIWFEAYNYNIYSSELVQGEWNTPKEIGVFSTSRAPELAMDDNGNAIVVWEQTRFVSGYLQIYKNEFKNGNWISPEAVSANGVDSNLPSLAMSKSGNAIVSWQQNFNNTWQIYRNDYINGVWDTPLAVSLAGITTRNPFVKMDSNDGAILVWNEENGTNWQVMISQLTNGVWSEYEFFTISDNTLNPIRYDIASNFSGEAIFVWNQSDNAIWNQYRSLYQ